jgi:two-component system chemotaxis response regulator CheY
MAKVLIIDDAEEVRESLRTYLVSQGYEVIEASDGKEGLEKSLHGHGIDVIITDHNMPEMSGLDMLRAIRSDRRYRNTPILFHTNESRPDFRATAQELGVKGWLVKPVPPQVLKQLLDKLIR